MHALLHSVPPTCSRPPPTHASARDSRTPTGKSGTVSCGVTAPFSWVLVHKFLLCPPRDYFPVLCKFWQLYGGVIGDLLQEGLCHTQDCCTQSPCLCIRPPPTHTSSRDSWTLKGKHGSVFCGVTDFLLDLVHTRFCLCPPRVCFPVLCKFWQLYGGVNGNLL